VDWDLPLRVPGDLQYLLQRHAATVFPGLVWIGAGAKDWLCGYQVLEKALEAQNNKYKDIDVKASDETIHWSPGERTSWITNRWIFKATVADRAIALPLRCTWILVKEAISWKIVHFHKSVGMVG
jgi:hypothetical protein